MYCNCIIWGDMVVNYEVVCTRRWMGIVIDTRVRIDRVDKRHYFQIYLTK